MSISTSQYQIGGDHYLEMNIQPWDALYSWMSAEEFSGFLRGNCVKYLARAGKKSPKHLIEDLEKAQHYLTRLIEHERNREHAANLANLESSTTKF